MAEVTMTDLKALFAFPFRGEKWQQKFLLGCVVTFAGFIIPVIPWILLYGYAARVMRQIIVEKRVPVLPEWDEWEGMLLDGVKLLGASFVYLAPTLLLTIVAWMGMIAVSFVAPILGLASERAMPLAALLSVLGTLGAMATLGIGMLVGVVVGMFLPVVLSHAVAEDSFQAAFRIREWWAIFRANWGGFLIAYVLVMGVTMVATFAMQMLYVTVVLCCLLPLLLIPFGFYALLLSYALYAQAYAEGQESLAAAASS